MSATEMINIEPMFAAIVGENPAGANLQYAGLHDEIREARRAEESLEQGEWKYDLKTADWHKVVDLATDALTTQTKDLQVCVWLVEALVKVHGFVGLRDGLRLTCGLLEFFWDNIYPEIDEGDLEARANAISWLDRQLAIAIKEVPITKTITGTGYSFLQWQESNRFDIPENLDQVSSEELERANELKAQAAKEGKITSEQWRIARNATPRTFYEQLNTVLAECWQQFQALDSIVDEKFQRQTPGIGTFKKAFEDLRALVDRITKEKRLLEPDAIDTTAAPVDAATSIGQPTGEATITIAKKGPLTNREEALKRLAEVAEYFHTHEPQSPVSYLVERAIKWGKMPLEAWLQDVIKNDGVMDHLRETLGFKTATSESKQS